MAVETSDSLRSRTPASKAKVSNPNESPSVQKSTKNSQKSKTTTAVAAVERNVFLALSFGERQLKQIANRVFPFLQMWFQWIWTQWIPAGVKNRASKFVTKHRDIFVCVVLLPASVLFEVYWFIRRVYLNEIKRARTEASHQARVEMVQEQVRNVSASQRMCTARPGWLTICLKESVYKKQMACIDLSELDNVISINEEKQTVLVEPNCSMGQITKELIPKGWTLAVTPELDDLTVGGLIAGFGIETSSHKYGLFQHTCVAYELILPNGELVKCSKDQNPDLFAAIPWSYGTLGFLVGAEIKIVPAKPYVHLTYLPCHSLDSMVATFEIASRAHHFDFVECLTYTKDTGVVMLGKMVDWKEVKALNTANRPSSQIITRPRLNAIGRSYKPWFFKHVETFLNTRQSVTKNNTWVEFLNALATVFSEEHVSEQSVKAVCPFTPEQEMIPLRDYFHRHTRSIFWELQDIVPFGNNVLFRYLFGWIMPPRISMLKLTTTEELREIYDKAHVVQDMLVPMNTLKKSILKFHEQLRVYPLWLCPMRLPTPFVGKQIRKPIVDSAVVESQKRTALREQSYDFTCTLPGMVNPVEGEQLYVDIGAYGVPMARDWVPCVQQVHGPNKIPKEILDEYDAEPMDVSSAEDKPHHELHVNVMRRIEKYVRENNGYQALYADTFLTSEEFRQMFDHRNYDQLRKKYKCDGRLPAVYDKVCRKARR